MLTTCSQPLLKESDPFVFSGVDLHDFCILLTSTGDVCSFVMGRVAYIDEGRRLFLTSCHWILVDIGWTGVMAIPTLEVTRYETLYWMAGPPEHLQILPWPSLRAYEIRAISQERFYALSSFFASRKLGPFQQMVLELFQDATGILVKGGRLWSDYFDDNLPIGWEAHREMMFMPDDCRVQTPPA